MTIKLKGSTDGSVSLTAPADTSPTGTDITLTLPTDAGSANQFIKNSGTAGTLDYSSMIEDSSGNIGIGTASPNAKLDITASGSDFFPAIELSNFSGNGSAIRSKRGLSLEADYDNNSGAGPKNEIVFKTDNNERMRIATAGGVGIGTSSPGGQLEVKKDGTGNAIQVWRSNMGTNNRTVVFYSPDIDSQSEPFYWSTNNAFAWHIDGTEEMRINSAGRLLVGATSSVSSSSAVNSKFQVHSTSGPAMFGRFANDATASALYIVKSRNTAVGGQTIVNVNDNIGRIAFEASDGSQLRRAATVDAFVDGTPGSADMPGRLSFSTTRDGASSPTERVRIGKNGSSSFYADSETYTTIRSAGTATTGVAFGVFKGATSTVNGTLVMIVRQDGDLENTNNSYTALSDIKLKENVVDASSQWNDIKDLRVRNYNFKEETNYGTHTQIGLVAQEVELVSPGLVKTCPDRDDEGNDLGTTTKTVKYSVLYMKAVKALQEAMDRIETLEAKVAALEAA